MGKGLAFAAVGAAIGAVVWVVVIQLTGLSLWILAPIVGGAAGFGMMRGTQMRGGQPAGVLAAGLTLLAILAARYYIAAAEVKDQLSYDEAEATDQIASEVADEWLDAGYEVYDDEEEDYLPAVYEEAASRWASMSDAEQREYVAALEQGFDETAGALTSLWLLFDFGIFGTICAFLAAGTAFKTASITLEQALVERGHASADDAAQVASDLRASDGGFFARLGSQETPAGADRSGAKRAAPPSPAGEHARRTAEGTIPQPGGVKPGGHDRVPSRSPARPGRGPAAPHP